MRNNPRMTPQRWNGAGVVLLVIAVLLIIASLVSVFNLAAPVTHGSSQLQFIPASVFGPTPGMLRGVALGCFAGVAFFTGLACFLWSGIAEARQQRAEILIELAALRTRLDKTAES